MGFPTWSLWGMGLAGFGALLTLGFALLAQSVNTARRLGWNAGVVRSRTQAFTGYAFALLLLAFGFFLAGVPLGDSATPPETAQVAATVTPGNSIDQLLINTPPPSPIINPPATTNSGSDASTSGSFSAALPATATTTAITNTELSPPTATVILEDTVASIQETSSPTPTATNAATPRATTTSTATPTNTPTPTSSPTPTASPTPTSSPTPTYTPTPIVGNTAKVDTFGNTVWLLRSPGGVELVLVDHDDVVILLNRRANQGGEVWQEVKTVGGVSGWIKARFLIEA